MPEITTIRELVLDQLSRYHESTARELYSRVKEHPLTLSEDAIADTLQRLLHDQLAACSIDFQSGARRWRLAGVYPASISPTMEATLEHRKRTKTKPYTPNRIAGAYVHQGNLVIKLGRRTNAKSITLQAGDFAMLEGMYRGVLGQS